MLGTEERDPAVAVTVLVDGADGAPGDAAVNHPGTETDAGLLDVAPDSGTVPVMANGMALKAQAELIAANVRGAYALGTGDATPHGPAPLADVIPLVSAPLPLAHPPTTRTIDAKGRISLRLGGRGLGEVMGWAPGPLYAERDGMWIVLRPGPSERPASRKDGRGVLGADGRLRLPTSLRYLLGVDLGEEVAVLVLPGQGVVALCHPSRLLLGAPLALLDEDVPPTGGKGLGGWL